MISSALLLSAVGSAVPVAGDWLDRVAPVLTSAERRAYVALPDSRARGEFERQFWIDKGIDASQYFERLAYVDNAFGSGKVASGANTDQGRLYLSLGPPTTVIRVPSSRIFVPTEVWYYDGVSGLPVRSRLRFLFYRPREAGGFKVYHPQLQSVRNLLVPMSGTRAMFPVNDIITPGDILQRLKVSPLEQEVTDAATSVAQGVTGSGHGEILARAFSPATMLRTPQADRVVSRIDYDFDFPELTWNQYVSPERLPVVDVTVRAKAKSKIGLDVPGIEAHAVDLRNGSQRAPLFSMRLYLLPGRYELIALVDDQRIPFHIDVQPRSTADPAAPQPTGLTYQGNLFQGAAWVSLARQYLNLGQIEKARFCAKKAIDAKDTEEARAMISRVNDRTAGR